MVGIAVPGGRVCPHCDYDLRGLPGEHPICPECGKAYFHSTAPVPNYPLGRAAAILALVGAAAVTIGSLTALLAYNESMDAFRRDARASQAMGRWVCGTPAETARTRCEMQLIQTAALFVLPLCACGAARYARCGSAVALSAAGAGTAVWVGSLLAMNYFI
jgi:hypothetical protein